MKRLLFILALLATPAAAQQTLPGLPAASTPYAGTELFYCTQGGVSSKCDITDLATMISPLIITKSGAQSWELITGPNGGSTIPVPTFYPVTNNTTLALDIVPHGVPTDLGYGAVWNDMCTTDQIQFGASATSCLHLSAGLSPSQLFIGSVEYTSGTFLPLVFGLLNGDTIVPINTFQVRAAALGRGAFQELNGYIKNIRVITAAGAITAASTDHIICINKTVGAASAVSLFATPTAGTEIEVKDCKGDANTNNITITPNAGNIDAGATLVINTAYGKWIGVYSGTAWNTMN